MDHLHEACGSVIFRPTLVCFTVAPILSLSAMFKLFITFDVLVVPVELGVLPCKCSGKRRGLANEALHKV